MDRPDSDLAAKYYGLHSRFTAQPGQGAALAKLLLAAAEGLRTGDVCLIYLVGRSPEDPDNIYVTEAWTSQEAHNASLQDNSVRAVIQQARPLIADITRTEILVLGGKGIEGPGQARLRVQPE